MYLVVDPSPTFQGRHDRVDVKVQASLLLAQDPRLTTGLLLVQAPEDTDIYQFPAHMATPVVQEVREAQAVVG